MYRSLKPVIHEHATPTVAQAKSMTVVRDKLSDGMMAGTAVSPEATITAVLDTLMANNRFTDDLLDDLAARLGLLVRERRRRR